MSVSVYYSARRAQPLTGTESTTVEHVLTTRAQSFPYVDEEGLYLYDDAGGGTDEGEGTGENGNAEILAGSTKLPSDPDRWIPATAHVLDSVTALRRAVGERSGTFTWTTSMSRGTRRRVRPAGPPGGRTRRRTGRVRGHTGFPPGSCDRRGRSPGAGRCHRGGPSTSSALRGSARGCRLSLWRSMEDRR